MNIFIKEHQQLLMALLQYHVTFLLIGGYAVIYHGYERTTGDLDIWLQPTNENKVSFLLALKEFNIDEEDVDRVSAIDFSQPQMFFVGDVPRRIDFLTKVSGVAFDEAFSAANYFGMDGQQVPVIQYQHLILTKITTGRAKDKADIEELQRIHKYKA